MNLSWQALFMIAGAAQLLAVASYSAFTRAKFPKSGLRRSEQLLIVSAAIAATAAVALVDLRSLRRSRAATVQSAAVTTTLASCATVDVGMTETEVTRRLGAPDRRISDEETRGPGAAILLYESSRCAVHVFGGKVELVE